MSRAYRIFSRPYRHRSGGIRCLYRLAALLRTRGFEATVNEKPGNKDYVAIYPETVRALNPFGAPHFVRYMLQRPGVVGGPRTYPRGVKKVWYNGIYRGSGDDPVLTIQTIELDLFNMQGVGIRDTTSTWLGRAMRGGYMNGGPIGETIITHRWPPTRKGVADLLKRSKVFYTYEPFTAMTQEATLCGCPTIIMTDMAKYPISRKEINALGWDAPGLGWGMKEIDKARKTLPGALPAYLEQEKQTQVQLREFIEITQNM